MIQELLQNRLKSQYTMAPFIQFQPIQQSNERHFIGIGQIGSQTLDVFLEKESRDMHTIIHLPYCDKIKDETSELYQIKSIEFEKTIIEKYTFDINLEEVLGDFKEYVFIAEIGVKNTNTILQACINYLRSKGKAYSVIAIEPFQFQGMIAQRNATAFRIKNNMDSKILYFQLESKKSTYKEMKFHEAMSKMYLEIYMYWKRYFQTMELIAQIKSIA